MKTPRYTDIELQLALDSEIKYPEHITELDFLNHIQSNKQIHWHVNPFVTDEAQIRILLTPSRFNKWKSFQWFGQIVGTFIIYWGLRTWTYEMLLLLVILPFAIIPLPHFLFILCMGSLVLVKLYFGITIPLFWFIIALVGISYGLTKSADEVATRFIIKQGLKNWETFWRYYSKQIIFLSPEYNPAEVKNLIERYPELTLLETNG